jgi:hypothetical protein
MISMFGGRPDDHPPCVSIGRRPGGVHVSFLRELYSRWCRSRQALDAERSRAAGARSLAWRRPRRRRGVGRGRSAPGGAGPGDTVAGRCARRGGGRLCRGSHMDRPVGRGDHCPNGPRTLMLSVTVSRSTTSLFCLLGCSGCHPAKPSSRGDRRPALPGPWVLRAGGATPLCTVRRPGWERRAAPPARPGHDRAGRAAALRAVGGVGEVGGDDRVELGAQQLVVRADEVGERRGGIRGGRRFPGAQVHGVGGPKCGVLGHTAALPRLTVEGSVGAQALICLCPLSAFAMEILRGLAFSAIGIRRVSTPAS